MERLRHIRRETGLDASRLRLEITENVIMQESISRPPYSHACENWMFRSISTTSVRGTLRLALYTAFPSTR